MAEIKLKLKKKLDSIPMEADVITPDNLAGKSVDDIKKLTLFLGNTQVKLGEYFDVAGTSQDKKDTKIIIDGDLSKVKRIGEKMTAGEIIVNSNIGMHIGNQMEGGKIFVKGNADDWAGAMLKGGELEIAGNAGHYVGAAYRGFWQGMTNGVIKVKGKVGNESMLWAKSSKPNNRWPMLVCGGAGAFLAMHNHGGTIIVEGDVDRCAGADQALGTIVIRGKAPKLPSYKKMGEVKEITLPNGQKLQGNFVEYSGDHSVSKETNGRLYIAA